MRAQVQSLQSAFCCHCWIQPALLIVNFLSKMAVQSREWLGCQWYANGISLDIHKMMLFHCVFIAFFRSCGVCGGGVMACPGECESIPVRNCSYANSGKLETSQASWRKIKLLASGRCSLETNSRKVTISSLRCFFSKKAKIHGLESEVRRCLQHNMSSVTRVTTMPFVALGPTPWILGSIIFSSAWTWLSKRMNDAIKTSMPGTKERAIADKVLHKTVIPRYLPASLLKSFHWSRTLRCGCNRHSMRWIAPTKRLRWKQEHFFLCSRARPICQPFLITAMTENAMLGQGETSGRFGAK